MYVNIKFQHSYQTLLNCFKPLTNYQQEIVLGYIILARLTESLAFQSKLPELPTHLCESNGVADLLKHVLANICYHAEFGHFALKCVSINTGEPSELGSARTPLAWDGKRG